MLIYDRSLHIQCSVILASLSNRDRAMFRRIGYLVADAKDKCCYSKIANLGAVLGDYGYKKIGRTQAKQSFSVIKKLSLFDDMIQPHRRGAYRITLNTLGFYLYHVLVKRIKNVPIQIPTFENVEIRPSKNENPTLLDQDLKLRKTDPLREILPSTTNSTCNLANKDGSFSAELEKRLSTIPEHWKNMIVSEYETYAKTHEVKNKEKVMEVICKRVITQQSEFDKIAKQDRERSLRMQAQTQWIIKQQDNVTNYTKEERAEIIRRARESIRQQS